MGIEIKNVIFYFKPSLRFERMVASISPSRAIPRARSRAAFSSCGAQKISVDDQQRCPMLGPGTMGTRVVGNDVGHPFAQN